MSEDIEIAGVKIPKSDWEASPASMRLLVTVLSERLAALEEQIKQNSQNSSRPPSSDGFGKQIKEKKKGRAPKHEGTPKAARRVRKLYPPEACSAVHQVKPEVCGFCGEGLRGEEKRPERHQVIEVPPVLPEVVEYQLHKLSCEHCGGQTRAALPQGVAPSGYGERLTAIVGLLSGPYRQSHRQVCALMEELFGVRLSRGGVGRMRQEMSTAVSGAVTEAKRYVQSQPVVNSDETSFTQGNRDGQNAQKSKGWLWVLATPLVSIFEIALSRSKGTAKAHIGENFKGIVISDRYSAYQWLALDQWQVCWAHLKRDLTAIAQRSGASKEIGEALLRRERRLFRWWHRMRDGTLTREQFALHVRHLRAGFKAELESAAALPIAQGEKTPLAKTVRTCRMLLKVEPALWTFVTTVGVEPTNNAAERALRPAVIWRRTSFGSQSQAGSEFVARMLTVSASLKAQQRSLLEFLIQACRAAREGLAPPSLLPLIPEDNPRPDDKPLLVNPALAA